MSCLRWDQGYYGDVERTRLIDGTFLETAFIGRENNSASRELFSAAKMAEAMSHGMRSQMS